MKCVLFHSFKGSPEDYWYPWIKRELESIGYEVRVPLLPHPELPVLDSWLPFALESIHYDRDTILIGHGHGVPLILSILERLPHPVRQTILVAGFHRPLDENKRYPILQSSYDWELIRSRCEKFVIINADNDPWGADDEMGRDLSDKLGGTFVHLSGEGHMGSTMFKQPYPTFEVLLELIQKP